MEGRKCERERNDGGKTQRKRAKEDTKVLCEYTTENRALREERIERNRNRKIKHRRGEANERTEGETRAETGGQGMVENAEMATCDMREDTTS